MKIEFTCDDDPKLEHIRSLARAEGYTRVAGIKEFVKVRLHAKLNAGPNGITSITFNNEQDSFLSYLLLLK